MFTAFFLSDMAVVTAQTKPAVKTDTGKLKARSGVDTTRVKFPLPPVTARFDNIDSADLLLTPAERIDGYGVIDTADLKLTACDFEKDANAMVLFDKGELSGGITEYAIRRQKRIKIFNENGKDEANIRIEYNNKFGAERILALEAETINLNNGKIEFTKLDPKLIYAEHTDKNSDAVTFSMPNVKSGSVIEYRYILGRELSRNVPDWKFQCNLPTRYSQFDMFLNRKMSFKTLSRVNKKYDKDTISSYGGHVWVLKNVPAARDEPYMRSAVDALQSLTLIISSVEINGKNKDISASWAEIGKDIANDKDFFKPFSQSLHDEDTLVNHTKTLKTNDEKIAFLFNRVKSVMKWNEEKNFFSADGIKSAWKKKSGNWGEINMILCRLLKLSGINACPMLVSTRDHGRLLSNFVNIYQINKLVTYVPVDSAKYYVLDATDKYNSYNEIPFDLLNSNGLFLDKEKDKYGLVFLKKETPAKQVVFVNAEIKPEGTMSGAAQINSFSYNKSTALELHKTLDEKKYFEYLTDHDNNLKITSLKMENAEADSLPLLQNIDFKLELPGTDDKYIYFNPNLLTSLHDNPFISENRASDIDFGCPETYSINGRYKIPPGFKIESLPKSINLVMPDKTITFKRVAGEQEGFILINYVIAYKKSFYPRTDYPVIFAYFKKMNEILNEQIVLVKI